MTTAAKTEAAKTALATTPPKPNERLATLGSMLEARRESLAKLVPKHLNVDKLMKVALNCVSKTPKLQLCSVTSVLQCVFTAAELGLEPGGALGHAYLVPFKDVCTLIIGYRGLIRLVGNSGELETIRAVVVRERDHFDYREGIEQRINHRPFLEGDAGPLKFVYCVAKLKNGGVQVEVMSRAQIDLVRARSRSSGDGPWVSDYDEMAKKTVTRRTCKYLPMSEEASKAFAADDEDFIEGHVVEQVDDGVARAADTAEKKSKRRLNIIDKSEDLAPALEASIAQAAATAEAETVEEPGSAG